MRFEFATAGRILFGPGVIADTPGIAQAFGLHAFVVMGRDTQRAAPLLATLSAAGLRCTPFTVAGEPTTALAQQGALHLRQAGADVVLALGGGSVIDAGKAIAALATNPGDLFDYLEVIGRGQPLPCAPLPFIAIPTTAGTGAEVTRNAVLASPEHRVKVSLRSPMMLPKVAIVDPTLTLGLPRAITATTGMDALTQLIEPFVSCRANPLTDGFCREGLVRTARSLRRVCDEPANLAAREDMAAASLFGGLALANAGLGAVHGFAAPVGGRFDAPHGAVCAALLPLAMEINLRALRQRQPGSEVLTRFDEIARILTGQPTATADAGVEWVRGLCGNLEIPKLSAYGMTTRDVTAVCSLAAQASSMKGNPLPLLPVELEEMLGRAI